jgi:hypothetical protein
MIPIAYSRHAETRMRQRGLRKADVELIVGCATLVGADVYFLSRKDVEREIRRRRQEIQTLERLRNQKVVVADGTVVTCYRSRPDDQKRIFRR